MKRVLALLVVAVGCGYRPIYGGEAAERLCVAAAPTKVPDFGALHAALRGARDELARAGALTSGNQRPCLRVELLRVQERATGITLAPDAEHPSARGTAVVVRGRGWVERGSGDTIVRDTGDMSREARALSETASARDAEAHQQLVRAAAEELGRAIAQRVLGLPTPSQ